jgi:hypothetical protein
MFVFAHTQVTYYRYMQFLPRGEFYYALLNERPSFGRRMRLDDKRLSKGRWLLGLACFLRPALWIRGVGS